MADIDVQCTKCGKVITVSEFADIAAIKCHACGGSLRKLTSSDKKEPERKLRFVDDISKPAPPVERPSEEWEFSKKMSKHYSSLSQERKLNVPLLMSWIMFLVIGLTTGFLRYSKQIIKIASGVINLGEGVTKFIRDGGVLPKEYFNYMVEYAPFVVLVLYIGVILMAFKDSVFQGVLCLFVPLYPFFYLFAISDNFYFRAIFAGVLVGTAEDSFIYYRDLIARTIVFIEHWIQHAAE
jgi:phage FluMu protein Com